MYLRPGGQVPAEGRNASRQAGGFDLHGTTFFEVRAHRPDRLPQSHACVPALPHKSRRDWNLQRCEREVFLVNSALGQIIANPVRIEFLERLQRSDAQFLRLDPAKHFLRLEEAL